MMLSNRDNRQITYIDRLIMRTILPFTLLLVVFVLAYLYGSISIVVISGLYYDSYEDAPRLVQKYAREVKHDKSDSLFIKLIKDNVYWRRDIHFNTVSLYPNTKKPYWEIKYLTLGGYGLKDVSAVSDLAYLELFSLSQSNIDNLDALKGKPLRTLCLKDCPSIENLEFLKDAPLVTLVVSEVPSLNNVDIASLNLTALREVHCRKSERDKFVSVPKHVDFIYVDETIILEHDEEEEEEEE